jgi:metallo-beta-lactamase class B
MFPPKEMLDRSYLLAEEPFKIKGNLYSIGNTWCSSHLIDTGEGLIILDVPCIAEMPYLIDAIWRLGFDPKDIKYIIVSHAHVDHYGCVNALKQISGAKTFMGKIDVKDMKESLERFDDMNKSQHGFNESFVTDVELEDGDIVELGNTKIRCVLTPGHTIGTMSHFWDLEEDGKTYHVGIYGGAGFGSVSTGALKRMNLPLSLQEEFGKSIDKVWNENVDIMLGNHPFHNDIYDKHERMIAGEQDAFVDSSEWKRFLTELRDGYTRFLKMSKDEVDNMYKRSAFLNYRNIHNFENN